MDVTEILALHVRRLRQQHGMTQEDLAERVGVSARYIGSIERAAVTISIKVLMSIASALEVEPGMLLSLQNRERSKS
jgi:transcriptional regulator with XRE-family HTH domain